MKAMHQGTLIVTADGTVRGMIAGDVIVRAPARVVVSGMVAGDVVVEPGAFARVSGMVAGRVTGDAEIKGLVGG